MQSNLRKFPKHPILFCVWRFALGPQWINESAAVAGRQPETAGLRSVGFCCGVQQAEKSIRQKGHTVIRCGVGRNENDPADGAAGVQ